jgi:energy-coupling factor transporter ATP-binding protein EcfA2
MPNTFCDRERKLLADLAQLVSQRVVLEGEIASRQTSRDEEIVERHRKQRDLLTAEFQTEISKLRAEYQRQREQIIFTYESSSYATVQEEEQFNKQAVEAHEDAMEKAKRRYQVARRVATDQFNEQKDRPQNEVHRLSQRLDGWHGDLAETRQQAEKVLRRRCCAPPAEQPPPQPLGDADPLEQFHEAYGTARQKLTEMIRQPAAQFLEAGWPFLIFLFTAIACVAPAILLEFSLLIGPLASLACGVVVALVVRRCVQPASRRQTLAVFPALLQAVADGDAALDQALRRAQRDAEHKYEELVEQRESAISEAHVQWSRARVELTQQHQEALQKATERFKNRRKELKDTYHRDLEACDAKHPPLIAARERKFADDAQRLLDERQAALEAGKQELARRWSELVSMWTAGMQQFMSGVDALGAECSQRFPAWDRLDPAASPATDEDLPFLPFAALQFDLHTIAHGVPQEARLRVDRTEFSLPVVLSYPECPSLLYEADGAGRDLAIQSLQLVMLRLLTALPPGKVRFTIIDPIGLGQNFSAFMHLADFDERLVASRIWTELPHINRRLSDLTEHMENVIQKYLRNEFASIQEYNHHAGEVAEPFQILVVANFPANFTEESARRLVSIAASGPRCGVYTLVSVDRKMKLPRNFELADLAPHAVTLEWRDERFWLRDPDLGQLPLTLEPPPDGDRFTDIVRVVGERAKDSNRVEVPFASVVAPAGQWWSADSRGGIEVPLGRAGATKLQSMRLGEGTSQHVLISGKTGSGKSTLLHALITNLSTHYSPHEVQFYLIDFKKGVEFKAYAALELPHARVIAIESEREFGMSVLERLDQELKRRGDLFREQGVQDLKGYRDAHPQTVMPRILLIIDEFQEFFVKDDKIAQDAALYLDRLVRQGRAFGIHVLLGSQTLAGAYSLARSTLGQMAVRIALQCSEADAHLILSDDNTAARLLSRPGEAIYNDANGLFEGNHPFQVVWLPDHEREQYVEQLAQLAQQRGVRLDTPVVFEGNAPADPAKNLLLRECLESATARGINALAPRAWLGDAVAIKDPAAAVFSRESGKNLLMVGQQEQAALGILANCLISLAAELTARHTATAARPPHDERSPASSVAGPPAAPRFYILDGERMESPTAGFWKRLARQLPADITVATPEEMQPVIAAVAAEVDRRLGASDESAGPLFLFIYNLGRFRDLRKSEDFSFSLDADDSAAGADKKLATILREGPPYGVHALIWCDTFSNLGRWIDRQSMNDLALRVLFQMSATDSANLMDSPEAGRLGMHRAILYREERGEFEKFRPYSLPSGDWLAWVKERLRQRSTAVRE